MSITKKYANNEIDKESNEKFENRYIEISHLTKIVECIEEEMKCIRKEIEHIKKQIKSSKEIDEITKTINEHISKETDKFIELICEYIQKGFLVSGIHYVVFKGKLHIDYKLCSGIIYSGNINTINYMKRMIRKNKTDGGYVVSTDKQIFMNDRRPRCIVIDIKLIPAYVKIHII